MLELNRRYRITETVKRLDKLDFHQCIIFFSVLRKIASSFNSQKPGLRVTLLGNIIM